MLLNRVKKIFALILCVLCLVASSTVVCGATSTPYTIDELNEMVINLPNNMLAVTRSSKMTDQYFSLFGLNYDTTMDNFKNGDIYLQGMDTPPSLTLTVTMTKTEESKGINNYNLLQTEELAQIAKNFINQDEYVSCTPDQIDNLIWLNFEAKVIAKGKEISAYQANTVYNGMSINITLQRNSGNITAEDYEIFSQIVSSVSFNKESFISEYALYILIGGAIFLIALVVVLIIIIKKISSKKKQKKNNQIIEELAGKYKLNEFSRRNHSTNQTYAEDNDGLVDISPKMEEEQSVADVDDENTDDTKVFTPIVSEYDKNSEADATDVDLEKEIDEIISDVRKDNEQPDNAVIEKALADADSNSDNSDASNTVDANTLEDDMEQAVEDDVALDNDDNSKQSSIFAEFDVENTEEEDYLNDEELVRAEAKHAKFYDSDDFFEEAPYKTKGVISRMDIKDAEDYDVIEEVEKRAVEVKKEKPETEVKFAETMKKIGSGIKHFGIHFGYLCTNVYRMIKRKRIASKRRKAEEARRERARMRAERENYQRRASQDGSLVQVHRRDDRRVPPTTAQRKRRNSSSRRPRK